MNRIIGQNWEEVAAERVKAGESFKTVANDYGLISQSDLQEENQSLREEVKNLRRECGSRHSRI